MVHFSRFTRPQDDSVLHISHNVTEFEFFYEPFYVSLDTAPRYDERFVGYGFTRNTQVRQILATCSMSCTHLAGVRDELVRLAVPGAVAHLQHPLGAAEEEGKTNLEGETELKQQE